MRFEKDKIKGLLGTIIFHALLLVVLLLVALRTPLPLPAEGGVEVNLGSSDDGMGNVQPDELSMALSASPPPSATSASDEMLTQETDEAPALEPKKVTKPEQIKKTEAKQVAKAEPTPAPQPKVDSRAMFPGKGTTTGKGGNEGITGKPEDQGKVFGDPNAKGYNGTGGSGGGIGSGTGNGTSFTLDGRKPRQIPKPSNQFKEKGTVVVTIFVNRAGKVIRVTAGAKGTTNYSNQLRQLAEQAALKATFSPKETAPEEQKGTITYNFELN